jgi:hypothetical protein
MCLTVIYYRVVVRTGHKSLDAEANAYVTLFGEDGISQEFHLEQRGKNVFESGGLGGRGALVFID